MKQLLLFLMVFSALVGNAQIITTVAGGGTLTPGDGEQATACFLASPISIAFDTAGNYYITERDVNRIRKVATNGIITTIAGIGGTFGGFSGDNGPATAAEISDPYGLAIDAISNIYFSDGGNGRIRKIDRLGIITTIAGTGRWPYNGENIPATDAQINPGGIAIDRFGNIYFADHLNKRVRKINTLGFITTVGGTGVPIYNGDEIPATSAKLNGPNYVAVNETGEIFVADYASNRVRKIDTSGIIHTIVGDSTRAYLGDNGPATNANLDGPIAVYCDRSGNLFISDFYNNVIRKVNSSGIITTIAGNGTGGNSGDGGPAILAELGSPIGVATDAMENLYIVDAGNKRIRRISSTVSAPQINKPSKKILLFPNPSNTSFCLKIPSDFSKEVAITITNTLGQKIKELTCKTNTEMKIDLDVPAGVYYISANGGDEIWNGKVVVN